MSEFSDRPPDDELFYELTQRAVEGVAERSEEASVRKYLGGFSLMEDPVREAVEAPTLRLVDYIGRVAMAIEGDLRLGSASFESDPSSRILGAPVVDAGELENRDYEFVADITIPTKPPIQARVIGYRHAAAVSPGIRTAAEIDVAIPGSSWLSVAVSDEYHVRNTSTVRDSRFTVATYAQQAGAALIPLPPAIEPVPLTKPEYLIEERAFFKYLPDETEGRYEGHVVTLRGEVASNQPDDFIQLLPDQIERMTQPLTEAAEQVAVLADRLDGRDYPGVELIGP
jgi:hypothetical protein